MSNLKTLELKFYHKKSVSHHRENATRNLFTEALLAATIAATFV